MPRGASRVHLERAAARPVPKHGSVHCLLLEPHPCSCSPDSPPRRAEQGNGGGGGAGWGGGRRGLAGRCPAATLNSMEQPEAVKDDDGYGPYAAGVQSEPTGQPQGGDGLTEVVAFVLTAFGYALLACLAAAAFWVFGRIASTAVRKARERVEVGRALRGGYDKVAGCEGDAFFSRSAARATSSSGEDDAGQAASSCEEEDRLLPSPGGSPARSPSRSAARSRSPKKAPGSPWSGDEEDGGSLAAIMKLRPAARDSVGGDEDDITGANRPLVGSERSRFLGQ